MSFAVLESNPDDWESINEISREMFNQIQVSVFASSKGRSMKPSFIKRLHQRFANRGERPALFVSHFYHHLDQLLTGDTEVPNYIHGEYSTLGSPTISSKDSVNVVTTGVNTLNDALARSGLRYDCLPPILFFTIERQGGKAFQIPEHLDMFDFQPSEPTNRDALNSRGCRRLESPNYTLQAVILDDDQVIGRVGESFVYAHDMTSHGDSHDTHMSNISRSATLVMFVNDQESSTINCPTKLTLNGIPASSLTRLEEQLELHGEIPTEEMNDSSDTTGRRSGSNGGSFDYTSSNSYQYPGLDGLTTPVKTPPIPNPLTPVAPVKIPSSPAAIFRSTASGTVVVNLVLAAISIAFALIW